ncbi:hypothetical protein [Mycobacteroides abscessus]|uniref:Uncharacterized protein n=6 Tax=Mycobacteroides abscessus TaxID=36809 RepID=A0A1T7WDG9_9MYCO|nr:hypothetical protein [Mycobacteroides abscessus]ESV57346.1 hypothetical protein L830_3177 [Mycobacteroides abscessus MAB_082312_2258]ESV65724.1 hypothetical protein L833_3117 [Mycobacteroides abscessus MAB_091912_2446]EUA66642.1 hypothetical protein I540_5307 [Mycobacteroides abscessus subsp. bolletii 1513]AGM31117.1 hypothetical protein MASS_4515 [Mycobacteroides abscessus subsp. bolletii 50594]AIC71170.1 hypothetical protein MYCMA_03845 [Mycobacteroides abscessus subsp. massiliense str. G
MAVSVNLEKALDKAYENKDLKDILDAPPSALAGLTEKHDAALKETLNISTVRELGTNKYIAVAAALAALESKTG